VKSDLNYKLIFLLAILFWKINLQTEFIYSQSSDFSDTLDSQIDSITQTDPAETILENIQDENEDSPLLEFLQGLSKNPYDLNNVTVSELENIPFINSIIARKIIEYREENVLFRTKRELVKIEGITDLIYEKIKPFLIVRTASKEKILSEKGLTGKQKSFKGMFKDFDLRYRGRFLQDLQTKQGFIDSGKYSGSKSKVYNQLNFKYYTNNYNLSAGVTLEKDPGEDNIADFVSGFAEFQKFKFINKFIAGDYILNFGQGLGMWSSLSFSKNYDVANIKKRDRGVQAYTSVNEVQFFRGAASELIYDKFTFILFYSDNFLDASIDTVLNEVSSFYFDGYHRTISEISRKNSLKEKIGGARLIYNNSGLKIGASGWASEFSKNIKPDDRELFNFSGRKGNMLSFDYDYVFKNLNLFGEVARSQSGSIAYISSLQIDLAKYAEAVFSYRNYPEDFSPVHSFGFGEKNGNTQNERGFYAGLTLKPINNLLVNAYFDQFKFPYRSFFEQTPVNGNDFLLYSEWKAMKNFKVIVKYKNENKEELRTIKDEFNRDVKKVDNRNQLNSRIEFIYEISPKMRVKSRYEYVNVKYDEFGGNGKGYLFFTDFKFLALKNLSVDTRFVIFNTDSYDSRVYEYENDISGLFSNLAMYGKGSRWYVLVKYKPLNYIELSGKYAETYFEGVKSIGTGSDRIDGNINNRLNLSLEITL